VSSLSGSWGHSFFSFVATDKTLLYGVRLKSIRQLDSEETGHRTLSGEWVVNKSVWRRLRTEAREREMVRKQRRRERDAGVSVGKSALGEKKGKGETGKGKEEKVIYYIHGGEFRG